MVSADIWSPPEVGPTRPSLLWNHPSLDYFSTPSPPSEMVQPTPPLCLSFLLAQPGICSSHTHLMQMPKLRNRERERVGGFVYLGSWVQLVLQAYSNKVCVREKARRREKCIWRRKEQRTKIWVERRIFCSYHTFLSFQRIVGSFFARKKRESIKGRVFLFSFFKRMKQYGAV